MALKILSVLVDNKPGTLFKVAHMIRLMRLNIEGLTCGIANGGDRSLITMTVNGDDATLDFLAKQLTKVIDVFEAHTYTFEEVTRRELALVKLVNQPKAPINEELLEGSRVVERSGRSITVEVVGTPADVDGFIHRFDRTQILDYARTGTTAVPK